MEKNRTEKKLYLIILVFIAVFGYGVYNLFHPEQFPMQLVRGEAVQVREDLILGPYPSSEEFLKLKRMGVTVIVSLMSPDVPVEAPLVQEENRLCRKYEFTCVNFPLQFLTLHSDFNKQQVEEAVKFIQSTPAKKYIHCYLGRHRVALIQERLHQMSGLPN
jgi:hypothetical protein